MSRPKIEVASYKGKRAPLWLKVLLALVLAGALSFSALLGAVLAGAHDQLLGEPQVRLGQFILGTVEGDLHDIGKNLVGIMLESVGFEVIDLGVDVPASAFIQAILEHEDCKMVGISALLTTTLGAMERTVDAITTAGLRNRVKIFVGGAPVTEELARRMGADIYTPDAAAAARAARLLSV